MLTWTNRRLQLSMQSLSLLSVSLVNLELLWRLPLLWQLTQPLLLNKIHQRLIIGLLALHGIHHCFRYTRITRSIPSDPIPMKET
jgi:hypothetical protein